MAEGILFSPPELLCLGIKGCAVADGIEDRACSGLLLLAGRPVSVPPGSSIRVIGADGVDGGL